MNSKFEVESAGGWEAAEALQDYSQPPKSAKFVAALSWSWSPAHSRISKFWLCSDHDRSAWCLYEENSDYDTGKSLYACVAIGKPYRGVDEKYAAEQLLLQAWKAEWKDAIGEQKGGTHVESSGLLNEEDIARLQQFLINFLDSLDV